MDEVYADIVLLGSTPEERRAAVHVATRLGARVQPQDADRLVFSGPGRARARLVAPSHARPDAAGTAHAEFFVLLARYGLPEESAPRLRRLAAWARRRLERGAAGVVARFGAGEVLAFRPTGLELRPAPLEQVADAAATGRWLGALILGLAEQGCLPDALDRAGRLAARPGAEALRRAAARCAGPVRESARA